MQLVPGEEIDFSSYRTASVPPGADIEEAYENGEFRIVTEQGRTRLPELARSVSDRSIYSLEPDYQRNFVWDEEKQSALIESILMNVPIPPIFLYEIDYSKYEVMDGVQRLSTIEKFYNDELELTGLKVWEPLNGMTYSELPDKVRDGINRRYISSVILLKESAHDSKHAGDLKREVFTRLNTGGQRLEEQELRKANSNGRLSDSINDFVQNDSNFRTLWGLGDAERRLAAASERTTKQDERLLKRQGAQELVLRFFVNRQRGRFAGIKTLSVMLDQYWLNGNRYLDQSVIDSICDILSNTCSLMVDVLGEDALSLWTNVDGNLKPRKFRYFIYDSMTYAMSGLLDHSDEIRRHRKDVEECLIQAQIENAEYFDGRKTSNADFLKRAGILTSAIKSGARL
ncbi:DUF262 domain-containing protein [Corynebacterium suicordis]|uniref:DUF262 domain-containing protein n=1 Tax=Corynebacterium suicordis DSM 45110 TaxID=1121369 RepID=A0ABR9ZJS2_9CORY|nr:DUF262 domain-containing protein [Corynebacterium suicordis]MBF4553346.1 DUF262 domain-containing protein [Corynebacterium suicordis DSM 45110]MDR6277681.1 hypothetical protein [Corynebacterium suicordis]